MELLIVIVVIGILAAISVVAYVGVINNANNAVVKNDLANMAKQVEMFHARESRYPSPEEFMLGTDSMKISVTKSSYSIEQYNFYYCTDKVTRARFGIAIMSKSRKIYTISSTNGIIKETASYPSWGTACGAFGESELANIDFAYGYDRVAQQWRYSL